MKGEKIIYSEAFKLKVVEELESGKLGSQYEARQVYGIGGGGTLNRWLKKYGRKELIPKVVRVEVTGERDRMVEYRRRIRELEKALADAKVKEVLAEAHFEILCEELGLDPGEQKKKRRWEAVHRGRVIGGRGVTVTRLCEAARMSRQNYYVQRRERIRKQLEEEKILQWVREERKLQPKLGTRKLQHRLKDRLQEEGIELGRDRFFDLLRRHGLLIRRRKKWQTTSSRHDWRVYPNLIKGLEPTGPHQVWVSDLTYLRTQDGFVYLSVIMDAYSRKLIGYHVNDNLEAEGCLRAVGQALRQLPSGAHPIHHSDRGIQYCCGDYTGLIKRHGLQISMTEQNHCYENAQAERVIGILKQEYGLGSRFPGKAAAREAVRQAVWLYNELRPHLCLQLRTPEQVHGKAA